ncbi:zinc metalloprotease HtpX [Desulfurobacterium sp.]
MVNTVKTVFFLALLSAILLVFGKLVGGTTGMIFAFFIAMGMNFASWFFSDRIVLSMYGAREVSPEEAPQLHEIVEKLAKNAGIPKPKVAIVPMDVPNAFATGRDPEHGVVCVTTKLLEILDRDEVEGVLSHEIAHIRNRDTLISAVAATMASAIVMIADMARWSLFFGFGRDDERDGIAETIGLILMIIVAPVAATLIRMAISRSREFIADETGAKISGKPEALASALKKLELYAKGLPPEVVEAEVKPATSHMFIVNPFKGDGLAVLFSTHPPTEERIRRLLEIAKKLFGRVRDFFDL